MILNKLVGLIFNSMQKILLFSFVIILFLNGCGGSCPGGEVSIRFNDVPVFISSSIKSVNVIEDKIYIKLSEDDGGSLEAIVNELRREPSVAEFVKVDFYVGDILYESNLYFPVSGDSPWELIVLPNKPDAKAVFLEAGICLY